jgi:hypothetical protein
MFASRAVLNTQMCSFSRRAAAGAGGLRFPAGGLGAHWQFGGIYRFLFLPNTEKAS